MKIWHTEPTLLDHPALLLGEGPSWDDATGTLALVGIDDRLFGVADGDTVAFSAVPDFLGCAVPWQDGRWLGAYGTTVAALTAGGTPQVFARIPLDPAVVRANDGKCDPSGRFWVGVMSRRAEAGQGSLWVVEPDGSVRQALGGLTVPNGLGWSPDGTVMYVTDSLAGTVTGYAYDDRTGTLGEPRSVIFLDPRLGVPDGLAVDAAGALWTAVWDGGAVLRHSPDGALTGVLEFPVSRPTSCAFTGGALDELVVTSAAVALSPEELARSPLAGRTFRLRVDAEGLPAVRFAGTLPAAAPSSAPSAVPSAAPSAGTIR
ncbi:SMP-30/gluconolactonase/LRE family protein [Kitasatospora sp. NPDC096147]|uniref:SMP-30/gluconolactonase/LRE family protein n=1 Tax=Kitasatospora sp. NPDC096147 TaxID=3364093 RepID=UPI00380460AA